MMLCNMYVVGIDEFVPESRKLERIFKSYSNLIVVQYVIYYNVLCENKNFLIKQGYTYLTLSMPL